MRSADDSKDARMQGGGRGVQGGMQEEGKEIKKRKRKMTKRKEKEKKKGRRNKHTRERNQDAE